MLKYIGNNSISRQHLCFYSYLSWYLRMNQADVPWQPHLTQLFNPVFGKSAQVLLYLLPIPAPLQRMSIIMGRYGLEGKLNVQNWTPHLSFRSPCSKSVLRTFAEKTSFNMGRRCPTSECCSGTYLKMSSTSKLHFLMH